MTTVAQWLAEREPEAPSELAARIRDAIGAAGAAPVAYTAEGTLAAAIVLLDRLLREGCATRAAAFDLLTADALVTYAFEAAGSDASDAIERRASDAMRRIASLGNGPA